MFHSHLASIQGTSKEVRQNGDDDTVNVESVSLASYCRVIPFQKDSHRFVVRWLRGNSESHIEIMYVLLLKHCKSGMQGDVHCQVNYLLRPYRRHT